MIQYMLDTNTVSYLIKGFPNVVDKVTASSMSAICISAITEGELLFGLGKRPEAKKLHHAVNEFLIRVSVLPWTSDTAEKYGSLRAQMETTGLILAPLDMLIAAHALEAGITLISSNQAFTQVPELSAADWNK